MIWTARASEAPFPKGTGFGGASVNCAKRHKLASELASPPRPLFEGCNCVTNQPAESALSRRQRWLLLLDVATRRSVRVELSARLARRKPNRRRRRRQCLLLSILSFCTRLPARNGLLGKGPRIRRSAFFLSCQPTPLIWRLLKDGSRRRWPSKRLFASGQPYLFRENLRLSGGRPTPLWQDGPLWQARRAAAAAAALRDISHASLSIFFGRRRRRCRVNHLLHLWQAGRPASQPPPEWAALAKTVRWRDTGIGSD